MAVPVDTLRAIRSLNTLGASGALSAHSYLLPQQAPAPAVQQAPYDDGVEAITQGLQHVRGETGEYYKKVAALKSFMHNVQSNLGIDVRTPDLSRPESIELNQIYQDALTDIMTQGNKLKQSGTMQNMLVNQGALFFEDPTQKAVADMAPQQGYSVRQLEPIVTETNNLMEQAHYAGAFDQARQLYEEKKAYYEQKIKDEPDKAAYYTYQLNGLIKPRLGVKQFAPSSSDAGTRRFGRQVSAAGNWIKKITNMQAGAHDSFTPDPKRLNEIGKPILVSKDFANIKLGDEIVREAEHDPDANDGQGATYLVLEGKDKSRRKIDITNEDPQNLAAQLSGLPAEAIIEYAEKNNLYDEFQQVQRNKILGEDYLDKRKQVVEKSQKLYDEKLKESVSKIEEDLKAAQSRGWFEDDDRVAIGNFRVVKRKDGYEIENLDKAIDMTGWAPIDVSSFLKNNRKYENTEAGLKKLINFLVKRGAHLNYITPQKEDFNVSAPPTTTTGTVSATPSAEDILKAYRAKNNK